eukprot:8407653-Alexandrium_andersonii.AAC.1
MVFPEVGGAARLGRRPRLAGSWGRGPPEHQPPLGMLAKQALAGRAQNDPKLAAPRKKLREVRAERAR